MVAWASAALAFLALPNTASACLILQPTEHHIARGYESDAITAVALVEVISAEHLGAPYADTHPWLAKARIAETLYKASNNSSFPESIEFERGWGSAACERDLPSLPRPGDLWVVYFWMQRDGRLSSWLAITPGEAWANDPRVMPKLEPGVPAG